MSHPNLERRRNRTFRVEVLESRALLSTVFKGTFDGTISIIGKAEWSATGTVHSSNTKTVQGAAFAGVECEFNGEAKASASHGKNFTFTGGVATLINPERDISLGAYFKGSTNGDKITLEGRKEVIGHNHVELIGSPPFRLYPEGTFSATGKYDPDTASIKITFKFDVTKV